MSEHDAKVIIDGIARDQWHGLTEQQKAIICCGMTPIELTRDPRLEAVDVSPRALARLHAVALMTCAGDRMIV